ncbi:threonine/serine dehydratase [Ktedonosporobacter rubrisoli]|uniref:threonine ammonia-lyase n=1 Tax=Ktedonosporobacter rubrisoli TaxID=2509675 RepID=A0A4P6K3R7_KTERU|nr:threonine/serine dehydratase [Ktedonosporobacter rubrisoli]QBD82695.1 threonine/serine dehydratase [Ktedonosporobacter rubrisoli]
MHNYTTAPELSDGYIGSVWEKLPRYVRPTLLLPAPSLSTELKCELTIASETFQHTGSFKFRAAYNLISSIEQQHVITASSGNFGQAVAYACKLLRKTCTIVMPATSARVKIEAIQAYGGTVDLIDVQQISREERVSQLMEANPGAFEAHAYDDYRVIAGNSTLGKDIFSAGEFDTVVVPIGGGGLSSGVIIARDLLQAQTAIIGAEPLPGNDAAQSLHNGRLISNAQEPDTIADGARTRSLGHINWEILQRGIKDIIEVPDRQTLRTVRSYFRYVNLKVEPTGALTLGALFSAPERFYGQRVCCIVSGGNVDPAVYAQALLEQD